VVEIGSNDGYQLQYFAKAGIPVLGIDPAEPARAAAAARGVRVCPEFFGRRLAERLAADGTRADLILAHNVMAHVPDVNDVAAGIRALLAPDGLFLLETPYVKDLLDGVELDTIYHEHVFYYSLTALGALLGRHGLAVRAVERLPIHGGSLRVSAAPAGGPASAGAGALLAEEAAWGVAEPAVYRAFAARARAVAVELASLVRRLTGGGARVAAYGAAAKGTMLLHATGIADALEFVVDRNPLKHGRLMPGTRLPIHPPARLLEAMPEYVLLLAWNLADEVMAQQARYRRRGGRFIVPIPWPRVIEP
jgi:SAM-dependent methyltransferase